MRGRVVEDVLGCSGHYIDPELLIYGKGGEWSFENSGSRKILVEFHRSCSLVFLAVMCVSHSRFLYEGVSKSRFFARLRVSKSRFVCLIFKITSFRHLILNSITATFNFREKVTPNFC